MGDGATNDAGAVQAAIDACHQAGGGTVLCTPGRYRIGTIRLRSHVELHLVAGAVLVASSDRKDYQTFNRGIETSPEGAMANYGQEHLIYAEGEHDLAITGMGEINFSGSEFLGPVPTGRAFFSVRGWRPIQMVAVVNCRNVKFEGVSFCDAPCWTIWTLGCENVRFHGLRVITDGRTPNGDGLDIDTCRNVTVSDCLIEAGDDCIALKSDRGKKPALEACEYIAVTNCVLKTTCCAIRLGYEGDHPIRHCSFSNIVVKETRTGINMLVPREPVYHIQQGPAIEDVSFSDFTMDTVIPFFLWTGEGARPPAGIRRIRFRNIAASTRRGCYFGGSADIPIEDLSLEHVDLAVNGPMDAEFAKEVPEPYSTWDYFKKRGIPHALYFRRVHGLRLHEVRVDMRRAEGEWLSPLRTERVEGLSVSGFVAV